MTAEARTDQTPRLEDFPFRLTDNVRFADLDPNDGRVTLNGEDRALIPAPLWRRRVAYVPAEPGWWADTVGEHFDNWPNALPLTMIRSGRSCRSDS